MKKIMIYVLMFVVLISYQAYMPLCKVYAADNDEQQKADEKIEISFKVGDDILKINGKDVQVEKPVEVDGTVLVPLRVITEAFGAQVEWDEVNQSVYMKYSNIGIKLVVGSQQAIVDGHETTILEAPMISNDKTMVPLRFITENFGADVNYDNEAQKITVIKDVTKSNSIKDFALILKKTTKEKVGDSYQNWSIALPKKVKMSYRNFNGTENEFTADDGTYSMALVISNQGSETLDTIMQKELEHAKSYTIIDQGKKTTDGQDYDLLVYKGEKGTYDDRIYIKDKKIYATYLYVKDNEKYKQNKEISTMLNSLRLNFDKDGKTEDLSDVMADGYHSYENKKLKWSVNVLADWVEIKDKDKDNEVKFVEPKKDNEDVKGLIAMDMYSIEEGMTLQSWVDSELKDIKDEYNPDRVHVQKVDDITVNGKTAKGLFVTIDEKDKTDYCCDVYMLGKNYRYHLSYLLGSKEYNDQAIKSKVESMINSFNFGEPDFDDVGKLIDPDSISNNSTKKLENKEYKWSCEIPSSWTENKQNNDKDKISYSDKERFKGVAIGIVKDFKYSVDDYAKYYEDELTKKASATGMFKQDSKQKIKDKDTSVYQYVNTLTQGDEVVREIYYILCKNGNLYTVSFVIDDIYYSDKNKNVLNTIWQSMKFE